VASCQRTQLRVHTSKSTDGIHRRDSQKAPAENLRDDHSQRRSEGKWIPNITEAHSCLRSRVHLAAKTPPIEEILRIRRKPIRERQELAERRLFFEDAAAKGSSYSLIREESIKQELVLRMISEKTDTKLHGIRRGTPRSHPLGLQRKLPVCTEPAKQTAKGPMLTAEIARHVMGGPRGLPNDFQDQTTELSYRPPNRSKRRKPSEVKMLINHCRMHRQPSQSPDELFSKTKKGAKIHK